MSPSSLPRPQHRLKLALAQMTSSARHDDNILAMRGHARAAADAGCHLLALPEVSGLMDRNRPIGRTGFPTPDADPFVDACRAAAAEFGIWINTGSSPVLAGDGRLLNRSTLIDAAGDCVATYDKIHLFDVELQGQEPIRESARYSPGSRGVLASTPWGKLGMTICYDVRFPTLFRDYARRGAGVIFVPSAFAVQTGAMHWQVLLRARAIENGAFIVAAAQVARHEDGRTTWGHSMVVDPWGEVLLDMGGEAAGTGFVELDLAGIAAARGQIPSLRNERPYVVDEIGAREVFEGLSTTQEEGR